MSNFRNKTIYDSSLSNAWEITSNNHGPVVLYDSSGNPVGGETQVNTYTNYNQHRAKIAYASDGSFVVVWQSFIQDGSAYGIYGQRFDSAGNPVGDEFQINTTTFNYQVLPDVAIDPDNDHIMVVWASGNDNLGTQGEVFFQAFDPNRFPLSLSF